MKTLKFTLAGMLLLTLSYASVNAQTKGDGNITKQERQVAPFNAIKAGCAINIFVKQGEKQMLEVQTDENLQSKITSKVENETLILGCDKVNNATKMNIYVTVANLSKIEVTGAAKVTSEGTLKSGTFTFLSSGATKSNLTIETDKINIETNGAATNNLTVFAKEVKSEVSGAANMTLKGMADNHNTVISGAGSLRAMEFITDNTSANVSGAGNAKVMARKQLKTELSGAGSVTYFDKDNIKKIARQGIYQMTFDGMDNIKNISISEGDDEADDADNQDNENNVNIIENEDSLTVVVNSKKIVVITDDSVRIKTGQRDYVISDDGVKINKHTHFKKAKFKGHWDGVELGVNGFLNSDKAIDFPAGYDFMDLNYAKSMAFSLNFLEQNINLINQHLGLVTGMGITWNNYRFDKNVVLTDDGEFDGYFDNDPSKDYSKSKLVVSYLRVPLMLEYQTNSKANLNSFHISGGVVGALRLGSHSKVIYNGSKSKDKSDFYINPFKVDAIAKIGWGVINLYGTYSLTEMFRNNKGPEVYPFEIGISLSTH